MRAALTATSVAIATLVGAVPSPALAAGPGPRQIQQAVARAERSPSLWATINICLPSGRGRGGQLGVRGQMPALGFAATLSMTVRLGAWSAKQQRFVAINGSSATSNLSSGSVSSGRQQDGVQFGYKSPAGLLNARIDFTWTRGGKVLAETQRRTTGGHQDADYGRPAHYSAPSCRLG
ncbi:MAG: hypothetical protein ACR2NR_04705 [Solirubrobacteraceae bacterium]